MGLSIVIYQALLYVAIFITVVLVVSYLANKIKKNHSRGSDIKRTTLNNHMTSIQTRIKQIEYQNRIKSTNPSREKQFNSSKEYSSNQNMHRVGNRSNSRSNLPYYEPPTSHYREQYSPRQIIYYNSSEPVTFR